MSSASLILILSHMMQFQYANYSNPKYRSTGKGSLKLQLINQRSDFSFAVFSGGLLKVCLSFTWPPSMSYQVFWFIHHLGDNTLFLTSLFPLWTEIVETFNQRDAEIAHPVDSDCEFILRTDLPHASKLFTIILSKVLPCQIKNFWKGSW